MAIIRTMTFEVQESPIVSRLRELDRARLHKAVAAYDAKQKLSKKKLKKVS